MAQLCCRSPCRCERLQLSRHPHCGSSTFHSFHRPKLLCGGAAAAMVLRFWGARGVDAESFSHLVDERAGGISTTALLREIDERGWTAAAGDGIRSTAGRRDQPQRPPGAGAHRRPPWRLPLRRRGGRPRARHHFSRPRPLVLSRDAARRVRGPLAREPALDGCGDASRRGRAGAGCRDGRGSWPRRWPARPARRSWPKASASRRLATSPAPSARSRRRWPARAGPPIASSPDCACCRSGGTTRRTSPTRPRRPMRATRTRGACSRPRDSCRTIVPVRSRR